MKKRITKLQRLEQKLLQRLERIYSVRLMIIVVGILVLFLSVLFNWPLISFGTVILTTTLFFFLVQQTDSIRNFIKNLKTLREFLIRQDDRQHGIYIEQDFLFPKTGSVLDLDFDLYGKHSLFSQLSECFTDMGQKKLSFRLENPELNVEKLLIMQNRARSLMKARWTLTKTAILGRSQNQLMNVERLLKQFTTPFLTAMQKTWVFSTIGIWLLAIATAVFSAWGLNINVSFVLFVLFWFGSIYALGEIKGIFFQGMEIDLHLEKLGEVFGHLEKSNNPEIRTICNDIFSHAPANKLKKLRRTLSFLSIQGNPLVALLLNMISPWNLFFSYKLEKERQQIVEPLPRLLDNLSELEFYLSLTTMYVYQTQTFPEFTAKPYLETKGLYHPLIETSKVVKNDFHFSHGENLGLITGSNMSGKSTFLRAVGINHILAMAGAPVFAEAFVTYPSHLNSCIRVSDSIDDGYSYFYAEVRRLKSILQNISSGQPTFFIVDEIFKGTNNKERVEGGRAILNSFLSDHSMGFVTTHDMELAFNPPPGVTNWHFTDSFESGKITFSYKILPGPSTTTNALKIMELEGLFKGPKPHLRPV